MENTTKNSQTFVLVAILIAAITRFLPHPPNFTAITGMALFGGAFFQNKKQAMIIPFAAMLISDLFLGFHSTMAGVYLSFFLVVIIGQYLSNNATSLRIVGASIFSSLIFFLITNFNVWISTGMYPMTGVGLVECYMAAIPFYENSLFSSFFLNALMGDLFFTGILFGSYSYYSKRVAARLA